MGHRTARVLRLPSANPDLWPYIDRFAGTVTLKGRQLVSAQAKLLSEEDLHHLQLLVRHAAEETDWAKYAVSRFLGCSTKRAETLMSLASELPAPEPFKEHLEPIDPATLNLADLRNDLWALCAKALKILENSASEMKPYTALSTMNSAAGIAMKLEAFIQKAPDDDDELASDAELKQRINDYLALEGPNAQG